MLIYHNTLRGIVGQRTYIQYVYFHSAVTSLSMGMILYAKSSLELIVNNRIGKVGIRPLEHLPPHPIATDSRLSFAHRISVRLYECLSICLAVRGFEHTCFHGIRYTGCHAHTFPYLYLRIITYKRVILSYRTWVLLMIIKTPRSILFALEYFLRKLS